MFIRFILLGLSFIFNVQANDSVFLTATLEKDCKCVVSYCDMGKCHDKDVLRKKGENLGRFCQEMKMEKELKCSTGKEEWGPYSLTFCPRECLLSQPTPKFTKKETDQKYNETLSSLKKEYEKLLPPHVYSSLDKNKPLWLPAFSIGGVKNYDFITKIQKSFYLEAPFADKGVLKWFSVVIFHEKTNDPEKPKAFIGIFDQDSGYLLKDLEYPELSTYDDTFEHTPSILLVPSPELTPYLSIWMTGREQAKQIGFGPLGVSASRPENYFPDALLKVMKEKVADGQPLYWSQSANPASRKHPTRWLQLAAGPKEMYKEIFMTNSKVDLVDANAVTGKKTGECAKGHLAISLDDIVDPKAKAEKKFVACDQFRGWVETKELKSPK